MKGSDFNAYIEELVTNEIATQEEIFLVCSIMGHEIDTLDKILYSRTSLHDWDQFCREEKIENIFEKD